MKSFSRRVAAAFVFTVVLSLTAGPTAAAGPRDDRGQDLPAKIVKIVKHLQKFFGISTNDTLPQPPRP